MKKLIFGLAIGILVGVVSSAVIQYIGYIVYPVPVDIDLQNQEQMKNYIAALPLGAFLFILFSWGFGAGLGSFIATVITQNRLFSGLVVGITLFAGASVMLLTIPHPTWFILSTIVVYPTFIVIGCSIKREKQVNVLK